MSSPNPGLEETGTMITQRAIDDLKVAARTTKSSSVHKEEFVGTLGQWTRFEYQVRKTFEKLRDSGTVLSYYPTNNHPNHSQREQILCGDESSVQARFGQQVGHMMTSVAQDMNVPVRFSDFRATPEVVEKYVPDFAFIGSDGQSRIVGEAKTPWVHSLRRMMYAGHYIGSSFRKILGQIARYMAMYKLKYGFLTTYNQTIFLKQEQTPQEGRAVDKERDEWVLWYSNVVFHSDVSTTVPNRNDPMSYHGQVSLRECMLYLIAMAGGITSDFFANNKSKVWVDDEPSDRTRASRFGKWITDKSKDQGSSSGPGPGSISRGASNLGAIQESLALRVGSANPRLDTFDVTFGREARKYYFRDPTSRKARYVEEGKYDKKERLCVKVDGKMYWARVVPAV